MLSSQGGWDCRLTRWFDSPRLPRPCPQIRAPRDSVSYPASPHSGHAFCLSSSWQPWSPLFSFMSRISQPTPTGTLESGCRILLGWSLCRLQWRDFTQGPALLAQIHFRLQPWTFDLSLKVWEIPVVSRKELLAELKILGSLSWLQTVGNDSYSMRFGERPGL